MNMERRQIVANACVASTGIIFLIIMMWLLPDKALDLLISCSIAVIGSTVIAWVTKVDQRKDERTMQLMTLASRNAMFFLIFAMPMLAGLAIVGIIIIDAWGALMLLWIIALAIAWVSFFYYYTR
jgi:hypothetical protein